MSQENYKITALNESRMAELKGIPSVERKWLQFYPENVEELELPEKTLYQNFLYHNQQYPNQKILKYFGKSYTVKDIVEIVEKTKKSFSSMGIQYGDSVSVAMLTTPEFVITCFALNDMGVRVDLIDFVSEISAAREQMKNCHNKKLILLEELYDKLSDFIEEKEFDTIITSSLFDSMSFPIGEIAKLQSKQQAKKDHLKETPQDSRFIKWKDFIHQGDNLPTVEHAPYEKGKEAFTVYSSGSSNGIPTAYVITNDGMNATIFDHEIADMSFDRNQTFLNVLPSIYSTTITSSLFLPLVLGVTVELDPRFDKDLFPKQIKMSKANHFIVNATHGESLIKNTDLTRLIYPIIGGEAIAESVERAFNAKLRSQFYQKQKASVIINKVKHLLHRKDKLSLQKTKPTKLGKGYGASQFGACVTVTNERCNKIGTVGIPLPHTIVGIFDPDTDKEISYNKVGEIRVISPSCIKRVFNDPQGKAKIFKKNPYDGKIWGHSGDIGYLDEDGRLFIKGRMDNSYVKNGVRKYAYQIENEIKSLSYIQKVKVLRIATPDGEKNVAYVILKETNDLSLSDIIKQIFDVCHSAEEPIDMDFIRICENFPIAASGKINTIELGKKVNMLISMVDNNIRVYNATTGELITHSLQLGIKNQLVEDALESEPLQKQFKKIYTNS